MPPVRALFLFLDLGGGVLLQGLLEDPWISGPDVGHFLVVSGFPDSRGLKMGKSQTPAGF